MEKQWNNSNRIGFDSVTEEQFNEAIADISPLTEEELDELFPIEEN